MNGGLEFNLKRVEGEIKAKIETAFVNAGRRIVQVVQDRIHKDGLKKDESKIGEYTPYTKKLRRAKGLQTNYVDLVFDSILLDSQQFQNTKDTVKLAVTDDGRAVIMAKLESKYGKIAGLTLTEQEKFLEFFEQEYRAL